MEEHTQTLLNHFKNNIGHVVKTRLDQEDPTSLQRFVQQYRVRTDIRQSPFDVVCTQIELMGSFGQGDALDQVFLHGEKTSADDVVTHFLQEFRSESPKSVQEVGDGHSLRERSPVDYHEWSLAQKELKAAKQEAATRPKKKKRKRKPATVPRPSQTRRKTAGELGLCSIDANDLNPQRQEIINANLATVLKTCRDVVEESKRLRNCLAKRNQTIRRLQAKLKGLESSEIEEAEPEEDVRGTFAPKKKQSRKNIFRDFRAALLYELLHCDHGKPPEGLLERDDTSKWTVCGSTKILNETKTSTTFIMPVGDGNFHGPASVPIFCPTAWLLPGAMAYVWEDVFFDEEGAPCLFLLTPDFKTAIGEEMLRQKPRRTESEPCAQYIGQWDQGSMDTLVHGMLKQKACDIIESRTYNEFNAFTNRAILHPDKHTSTLYKALLAYTDEETTAFEQNKEQRGREFIRARLETNHPVNKA